ncbi:MAG: IS66 family insertion sequence element accessory protein TnpB [Prevotellaceae bacterium]|jgi:hypothetical protein|nr:IS66 family insertion sequence element accessory protein TnpB [Prevotellaceae bacterium]
MFSLNASIRYYLYPYPADLRKGFYTLSGIVKSLMGYDVSTGDAFIFINRSRDVMKILHMERGGMVIYHKKLEAGRFRLPFLDTGINKPAVNTTWTELVLMIEGISLSEVKRLKRWKPK